MLDYSLLVLQLFLSFMMFIGFLDRYGARFRMSIENFRIEKRTIKYRFP